MLADTIYILSLLSGYYCVDVDVVLILQLL